MSSAISPAVQQLIAERMATGQYASEEALLLEALQALPTEDEDLAAIQAALDSVDRGEPGVPLEKVFAKIRARYGIGDSQ
jgi:hypothetical protein